MTLFSSLEEDLSGRMKNYLKNEQRKKKEKKEQYQPSDEWPPLY